MCRCVWVRMCVCVLASVGVCARVCMYINNIILCMCFYGIRMCLHMCVTIRWILFFTVGLRYAVTS